MTSKDAKGTGRRSASSNIVFLSDHRAQFKEGALALSHEARLHKKKLTTGTFFAGGIALSEEVWSLPWRLGDFYLAYESLGKGVREAIMSSKEWKDAKGVLLKTFQNHATVSFRFPKPSLRRELTLYHHEAVMCLWPYVARANAVLDEAIIHGWTSKRTHTECMRLKNGYYDKHGTEVFQSVGGLIADGRTFQAICPDCPWRFKYPLIRGGSGGHYTDMSMAELAAIPVDALSTSTTTLFLWTPHAMLREALWLMEQWGFEDSHSEIVWRKLGNIGCGYRARMIHEHLLIGIRENSPKWDGTTIESVVDAPRGRHSVKPEIFYELIEQAVPGEYLELFARKKREGWTVAGDQVR